jgi:multidrug resistance efflux pump
LKERVAAETGLAPVLRRVLPLILILAGCSKGAQADLPYIGDARSLAAEWALVNEEASRGHLTTEYVDTMRASVREQLQTSQKALSQPKSAYGQEIAALLKEPDGASPQQLRAHATKLKQIEDNLESA